MPTISPEMQSIILKILPPKEQAAFRLSQQIQDINKLQQLGSEFSTKDTVSDVYADRVDDVLKTMKDSSAATLKLNQKRLEALRLTASKQLAGDKDHDAVMRQIDLVSGKIKNELQDRAKQSAANLLKAPLKAGGGLLKSVIKMAYPFEVVDKLFEKWEEFSEKKATEREELEKAESEHREKAVEDVLAVIEKEHQLATAQLAPPTPVGIKGKGETAPTKETTDGKAEQINITADSVHVHGQGAAAEPTETTEQLHTEPMTAEELEKAYQFLESGVETLEKSSEKIASAVEQLSTQEQTDFKLSQEKKELVEDAHIEETEEAAARDEEKTKLLEQIATNTGGSGSKLTGKGGKAPGAFENIKELTELNAEKTFLSKIAKWLGIGGKAAGGVAGTAGTAAAGESTATSLGTGAAVLTRGAGLAGRDIGGAAGLAGGLIWMITDSVIGYFKSKEWDVSKSSGAVGGAIGGTIKNQIGNAFANAGKFALLGVGIGASAGPPGMIIGGLIGSIVGGVLGYFGGEKIAQGLEASGFAKMVESIWDALKKVGKFLWTSGELFVQAFTVGAKVIKVVAEIIGKIASALIPPGLREQISAGIEEVAKVFRWVGEFITSVYEDMVPEPVRTKISDAIDHAKDAFNWIGSVFQDVSDVVDEQQVLLDSVLATFKDDKAIERMLNSVHDGIINWIIGLIDKIPGVSKIAGIARVKTALQADLAPKEQPKEGAKVAAMPNIPTPEEAKNEYLSKNPTAIPAPAPPVTQVAKTPDIKEVGEIAKRLEAQTGVPAKLILAQFGLESGWGEHQSGAFNFFGIKAKKGSDDSNSKLAWTTEDLTQSQFDALPPDMKEGAYEDGKKTMPTTWTGKKLIHLRDRFQSFGSLEEGMRAHADLLSNKGYKPLIDEYKKTGDLSKFASRYATDRNYKDKITGLMASAKVEGLVGTPMKGAEIAQRSTDQAVAQAKPATPPPASQNSLVNSSSNVNHTNNMIAMAKPRNNESTFMRTNESNYSTP